jgi:hypothetical protein
VNKKWINSVSKCRAYNSFVGVSSDGVSSDHRIVSTHVTLSLRANKSTKNAITPLDWSSLREDENIRNRYSIAVRNRFEALQQNDEHPNADSTYNNFVSAHKNAAEIVIPLKPKLKRKIPWETENISKKREYLQKAACRKNSIPTRSI